MKSNIFDTIVIGVGMSGGWAPKEFSEQGFKNTSVRTWTQYRAY